MDDNTPIFLPPDQSNLPPRQSDAKQRSSPWWFAIGAAVVLCCALGAGVWLWRVLSARGNPSLSGGFPPSPTAPTSTRFPTSTPRPSRTPNATQTQAVLNSTATAVAVQASVTQAAGWTTVLNETFDQNTNGWRSGHFDSPFATIDFAIQNGVYRWDGTAPQGIVYTIPIRTQRLTDFFMSADVHEIRGTPNAEVGLGLRQNGNGDHYYFAIRDSTRRFSFLKWMNSEWSVLLVGDGTAVILPGEWNHLAVLATGSRFDLFINDQLVGQTSDNSIARGINLLGITIDQENSQSSFEFDNVVVRVPAK